MKFVTNIPNMQLLTLVLATESAQNLAPVISAVAQAKEQWDTEIAPGGSLDPAGALAVALGNAGYTLPVAGTPMYTDMATLRASLPAPLNGTNGEGDLKVDQTVQFKLGNYRGYTEFLKTLRTPIFNVPAEPGDDDDNEIKALLAGIQLVYDMHATLTTNRNFDVPSQ